MSFSLFTQGGLLFILRWIHFLSGITWIGMLYYMNFVQGAYFNEIDAATKVVGQTKLLPKALWWFRWGAMFTFLSGFIYLGIMTPNPHSGYGVSILIGALFGITMFLNVWLIIWPKQKIVIASAEQVAKGGQPIPDAAAAGARGLVASRTNVLFSFPMLFFMGAAQHLGINVSPGANLAALFGSVLVIWAALELNAIKGKVGPMATVKGVIHCGLALALVLYFMVEFLAK